MLDSKTRVTAVTTNDFKQQSYQLLFRYLRICDIANIIFFASQYYAIAIYYCTYDILNHITKYQIHNCKSYKVAEMWDRYQLSVQCVRYLYGLEYGNIACLLWWFLLVRKDSCIHRTCDISVWYMKYPYECTYLVWDTSKGDQREVPSAGGEQ